MDSNERERQMRRSKRGQIKLTKALVKNDGCLVPVVEPLPCGRGVLLELTGAVKCTLLLRG